jgi:hypothetical protein
MKPRRLVTVLISCLFLAGCGGLSAFNPPPAHAPAVAARPRPDAPPAPDLRIPGDAVAASREIPLVPVPPVPLGRGAAPQAADAPRPNLPPPTPPALPPVPGAPAAVTPAAVTPAAAPEPTAAPAAGADAARPQSLHELQQQAAQWYAGVDSYIVRMTRREVVAGAAKPEEVMMFKFRKEPWSIHFKWVGKVGQGREVLYVKGQFDNKIHTRLAAGDVPLMPAGMMMALDVDSPMVRSASRHALTEAGIGASIEHLGAYLEANERGDKSHGVMTDLGMQKRPEPDFRDQPVRACQLTIPPGAEADLPNGGRRVYYFDPDRHLPMLITTYDDKNQEVEYYHYDRLLAPAALDAEDFNPDKLWSAPPTARPAGKGQ